MAIDAASGTSPCRGPRSFHDSEQIVRGRRHRVSVGGQTRFACVEGPEFDGHQVDFDELITRLAYYQPEERASLDSYHRCRLEAAADQLRN